MKSSPSKGHICYMLYLHCCCYPLLNRPRLGVVVLFLFIGYRLVALKWHCFVYIFKVNRPGRVAQLVGHLTRKSEVLGSIPVWPHTFVSPSADSRRAVVSYWRKYVNEVLVNHLGGLSLSRKSVVMLTDRGDMALDVYRGRKTTTTQQQHNVNRTCTIVIVRFM